MKWRIPIFTLVLLIAAAVSAQTDNTIYVRNFHGNNVGAKTTAAMATCNPSTVVPCILVLDPSLAAWPAGTMPTLCSHCYLWDFTHGIPPAGGGGNTYVSVNVAGSGAARPVSYPCTGIGATDTTNINGALAAENIYLTIDTTAHPCQNLGSVVLFSGDTLDWAGQSITSVLSNTATAMPQFSITNNAVLNPTTTPFTCALTAGSTAISCSSASFTNTAYAGAPDGDVGESFSCAGALGGGVDLDTVIANVGSGTAITVAAPTGAGITAGNFSCAEQLRDYDLRIVAGEISITNAGGAGSQQPVKLGIGHANRVRVEGGNWVDPDSTSSWHMVFWDVNDVDVEHPKCLSYSGYGKDCVDFEGPWNNVTARVECDVTDDCVALKPGEWVSGPASPFLLTQGAGSSATVAIKGSGESHGLAIYAPSCVNASGPCISSSVTGVVLESLISDPIHAGNGYPSSVGFPFPVWVACSPGAASDCGTHSYVDQLSFNHIKGISYPNGYIAQDRVTIGQPTNDTQYYQGITVNDIDGENATYSGSAGVFLQGPASLSYSTNVTGLSIYAANYSGVAPMVAASNSNVNLNGFFADDPNPAHYVWNGATVTNDYSPLTLPRYVGEVSFSGTASATVSSPLIFYASKCFGTWQGTSSPNVGFSVDPNPTPGSAVVYLYGTATGIMAVSCTPK